MKRQNITIDSFLISDALEDGIASFEAIYQEVSWQEMHHKGGPVPRLVCVQGDVLDDGSQPIYRHPVDTQPDLSPMTAAVRRIRDAVSGVLDGQKLNHALIQLYRSGDDCISEHADKTIDVARGSVIVNVSLGATRTLILRAKRDHSAENEAGSVPRTSIRVPLPHASIFVLGWETNRTMTHEIRRDKRDESLRKPDEILHGGMRISITFRHVATFVQLNGTLVGQGARKSSHLLPISSAEQEKEALLNAFSQENRRSDFDWDATYGTGFNVINFESRP